MVSNQIVMYTCIDLQTNNNTATRTVMVVDVTAPMITINGLDAVNASKSTADYTDLGATCSDLVDGDINDNVMTHIILDGNEVNEVNRNVVMGTEYTITYDCEDMAGNDAIQMNRTVTIVDDMSDPEITILEPEMITVSLNAISYTDPGATCMDDPDGDITANIVTDTSDVDDNLDTEGDYDVIYTCSDSADPPNVVTENRTVTVGADTVDPEIMINGDDPITITVGDTYDAATALSDVTCTDDVPDPKLRADVSDVNTNTNGTYTVTYFCIDASGNNFDNVDRTVIVESAPPITPVISISGNGPVDEGTAATFTLTADPAPTGTITVNVMITEDGDFAADKADIATVQVDISSSGTVQHTVNTDGDEADETNGSITATIQTGTGYTIADSPDHEATVTVNDDDMGLPKISITGNGPVTEGTAATFTLTADPAPTGTITVNVMITEDGDFAADKADIATVQVDISSSGTVQHTVNTDGDEADETDGSITATIQDGTGYTIADSPDHEATVTVNDDDMGLPKISITGNGPVTEGTAATFTLTADPAPTGTITVNVMITEDGDFAADKADIATVQVDISSSGTATRTVNTEGDEADETDGSITATIQDGTGYTIADSPDHEATVTVNDDDNALTPPTFRWTPTPSLLSFTVDQGSIEWDSTDPSDIKLIFSITATIDSSITPISGVYLTAYNSDGDWVKTLGSSGLSDSDNDAANGVNYDVLAADALDDDEAPSGDIIWLVLDDGLTSYSDPVPITVPATGNNVDMTTTPVSYNTAGFPPITRAVINDVSAIPAVHQVQQSSDYPMEKYTWSVNDPSDINNCDDLSTSTDKYCVEKFSDRLRLSHDSTDMTSISGNSKIVIYDWKAPTFDDGVTTLFNWNFDSISNAVVTNVTLAQYGNHSNNHVIANGSDASPKDITSMKSNIEALGDKVDLVIMLKDTDYGHICDDITLVADFFTFGQTPEGDRVNNAIYRIEVEEVTPDNSDFAGTLEYVMLNQLNYDDSATYTSLRTIDVDASIIVHEDFTDEDSVRINYFDLGADGVATQIAVQQEAPTHSGVVSFDADNYKIADTVTITVEDVDLNVNNDVVDIYTFSPPIADADFVDRDGMYMPAIVDTIGDDRDHILDVTFDDETWQTVASCWDKTNDRNIPVDGFNTFTGFTLMETASGSGVFTGDFQIPEVYCKKHNGANSTSYGTVESVTGVDIEVHYQDFRDASGEEIEVGAGAAIRANTGTVSLDRTVYPVPFDPAKYGTATDNSLAHNDYEDYNISGDLGVHIRVNDPDFDVSASGQDKIVNASEYLTVMIIRGADTKPIFLNDTDTVGDLNRDGVKEILEVAPDAGVFELDLTIAHNSGPAQGCPTELRGGCILQGDIIQVEYKDETDASGEENTITDSATFDLRNAVLQSDKSVYLIGSDMILTLIEPDFDLDNDGAETYPLDLIEWDSDADTVAMGSDDRFDPEPNGLRETGDSTGIFQSIIEIPAVLGTNDRLERGEEIELEYVDYGPSGSDYIGDETEDITLTVATSNFGATVELDQKVYSWTDKVYITIVAPDHNFDSASVDEIGDSNLDPIKIATRSADIDNYKLVETGPDTGIFTGEVILIGYDHNADGDTSTGTESTGYDNPQRETYGTGPTNGFIETDDEGGITVSFEFSEDETVVGSALIRWNIGEVQWLEASYPATGTGVVRVIDPDMNLNPEAVDNFEVDIWSDKDAGGIDLTVTETNQATGIFEGTVFFTVADESSGHRLRVAEGNTVTAEYDDNTLPDPYTTADELGVTATTLIGSIVPPLERVPASNLRIVDAFENSLDSVSVDQQVQIVADITNAQERSQEFAYLVQVQDENGVTVSLAWISGTLEAGQSLSPSSSWIPTDAGEYTATAFVWESVDNPTALSPPVTTTITVS